MSRSGFWIYSLNVEDAVMIGPQHLLVLQHGFRSLAVVDLAQQSPPRSDRRFHHYGIAQLLDSLQRTLGGEGNHRARRGNAGRCKCARRLQFVTAHVGHLDRIHGWDLAIVENSQTDQRPPMMDTALDYDIVIVKARCRVLAAGDVKDQLAVVEQVELGAPLPEGFEQQFFPPRARGCKGCQHAWVLFSPVFVLFRRQFKRDRV